MGYNLYNKKGFTIIEVMIALMVFTSMMVIIMAGVIFVSRQYRQSSNMVSLQEASRSIHQQISESIKFSAEPVVQNANGSLSAYCIGNFMYVYPTVATAGWSGSAAQFDSYSEGLYIQPNNNGCATTDIALPHPNASIAQEQRNLLPPGAKATKVVISPEGEVTTVFVRSPGDLIDIPSVPVGDPMRGVVTCKAEISGREFCASVKLTSSTTRRVGT